MEPIHVLVVEDSLGVRDYLTELVEIIGYNSHVLLEKKKFLTTLHKRSTDLVLLGPSNHAGRIRAFSEVLDREKGGTPLLIICDGNGNAKEKIPKKPNMCFLNHGFDTQSLKEAIQRLVQEARDSCHKQLDPVIIGQTPEIVALKKHVVRLSKSDVTILITGESGTGKELVARAIHKFSCRSNKPFVKVNSAALPSNLLESELFGYERGAFTGAVSKKPGKFELAHSGTIFLDEIGEIPLPMQAKLLQVLQDSEYSALGSINNTKVDTRVLAATNADLTAMVSNRQFRPDLYYRLNVVSLRVPPLRKRREDIDLLANHFLRKYSDRYGKPFSPLNDRVRELFYRYSWPGNVRELESSIQSIIVLGQKKGIEERLNAHTGSGLKFDGLDTNKLTSKTGPNQSIFLTTRSLKKVCKDAVKKAETAAIMDCLFHTRWNRRKAATYLQISYKALLNKIKEYGIEKRYRKMEKEQDPPFHQEKEI